MRKRIAAVVTVVALGLGLAACSPDNSQLNDAPVGKIDDTPAFVVTNADGFPNIAIRCYGKNGLYTTTRDAVALTIVVNDPQCGGTGPSQVVEK